MPSRVLPASSRLPRGGRRRVHVPVLAGACAVAALVAAGPAVATPSTMVQAPASAPADGFGKGGWWWDAMGIDELQRRGTGKGVTVAIVDTPVDPEVPEVRGRIAASSSPCLADGGGTRSPRATGRVAEHGTTMAALIGGTGRGSGPGGTGIRGIAPDARLLHYAVSYPNPRRAGDIACGLTGPGYDEVADGVVASIRAAVAAGAKIINLSLVTDYDAEYGAALLEAYRAGVIVVAGTDNAGRGVMWPALGNGVVTVNPVDQRGRVYEQSVKDDAAIGLAAPGKAVNSLGFEDGRWGSDYLADGSSNATALVSGGLAAMWSAHPDATANQLLQAAKAGVGLRPLSGGGVETWFRREGSNLPEVTERNRAYGWGIFAPADAVAIDPTTLPDENPFVSTLGGAEPSSEDIAALTATPTAPASPSATTSASAAPQAADDEGRVPGVLMGLGALVVLATAALALVLARRRTRGPSATTTGGDPDDDPVSTGARGAHTGARADGEE